VAAALGAACRVRPVEPCIEHLLALCHSADRVGEVGACGVLEEAAVDGILGTPDTMPEWEQELRLWSAGPSIVRIHDDGRMEDLGREVPDVHDRISDLLRLRTRLRAGELFGDTTKAKEVLQNVVELLDDLDEAANRRGRACRLPDTRFRSR
jgi:hypothetical protein